LFVFHLHALATYAVLVAGSEVSRALSQWSKGRLQALKEVLTAALPFTPAAVLLALSPTSNRAGEIEYGGLIAKLTGTIDAFHAYSLPLDLITAGIAAGTLAVGFFLRIARVHRHMLLPLGMFAVAYALMPTTIFGSFAADRRLATSLWMIAAASVDWRFASEKAARIAACLLIGLILIRTIVVTANWRQSAPVYGAYMNAFRTLPAGARVAAAVAKPIRPFLENPPVMFISSMAVVQRDAFVNTLFAERGHQPLRLRYQPRDVRSTRLPHIFYAQHGTGSKLHAGDPFARINPSQYDFVLLINPDLFAADVARGLTLVRQEPGRFALYRTGGGAGVPMAPSGQAWSR
jgi:hypothetical protein